MTTLPAAVLLDMDGTLVDTEPLWWTAAEATAQALGRPINEGDSSDVFGRPVSYTADYLIRVSSSNRSTNDVAGELEQRFLTLVSGHLRLLPGAEALLVLLHEQQIPVALVSASPRSVVDAVLQVLGRHRFAVSIAAGETAFPKPAPDPYLAALAALGCAPAECLAVEDSPTGIASATAAGLAVVMVPSPLASADGPRRTRVGSLAELDLAGLSRAFTSCALDSR